MVGIILIDYTSINRHLHEHRDARDFVVKNPQAVSQFLDTHTPKDQPPVFIPTGY